MSGPIYDVTVDYYAVLGVATNATDQEIRDAYRRLAKRFHPDANPSDPHATKQFQLLEQAYAVLKDSLIRRDYDLARSEYLSPVPETVAVATEQYFNCPHCQTPNVMPLEGLTIQSQCGSCNQPLLNVPTPVYNQPIPVPQPYASPTFTPTDGGYSSTISPVRRTKTTSMVAPAFAGLAALLLLLIVICSGSLMHSGADGPARAATDKDQVAEPHSVSRTQGSPAQAADLVGSWAAEWEMADVDGDPGTVRWNVLFNENGSFVLDITGNTLSGKQAREPRYSGTWILEQGRVTFSKQIPFPSATSGVEQVEVMGASVQSESVCSFTYGPNQTTVLFRRSFGQPSTPFIPSEAEQHRALMEDASMPGLWTYSMDFNFLWDNSKTRNVVLDLDIRHGVTVLGEQIEVAVPGAAGRGVRINGGRLSVDMGALADAEEWTLSLCFKPDSFSVESILYGEMDMAGSDLFDLILSREGHVYLAVWNEGRKPDSWQKTLLTTKRCEVGKWAGVLLHRRDGKVFGHVGQDSVNTDMQKSSRRTSQTDIGRKFTGVIDEVYVAGHRISSKAWETVAAQRVGSD